MTKTIITAAIAAGLLAVSAVRAEVIQLRTTSSAPYQVVMNGELSGVSVSILQCVFAAMEQPYDIRLLPWARAVEDLKHQTTDGIFTAMPASDLDLSAEMSYPFTLEKWYWVTAAASTSDPGVAHPELHIGGIRSSNQIGWMARHGIEVDVEVNNLPQLIHLLNSKRIDAFLVDERVFEQQLQELDMERSAFRLVFARYMPLGIYFSHSFLKRNPAFISAFNQHLQACQTDTIRLNRDEEQRIGRLMTERLIPALAGLGVDKFLQDEADNNRQLSEEDIAALDKQWQKELSSADFSLIRRIELQPFSHRLQQLQQNSAGLFSEIYVTDRRGLNLAESQPTSDYNQADEEAFMAVMNARDGRYTGPISYDESSHRFQVKTGWRIGPRNQPLGVVFVGLDVEQALRAADQQP